MALEPCEWPALYTACGGLNPDGSPACDPLSGMESDEVARFERMAGEYLSAWTGGQFGLCPVTILPCRERCWEGVSTYNGSGPVPGYSPFTPVIIQGNWFNLSCGRCGDKCGCGSTPSLKLPGPVASIDSVTVDGETLDPGAYRVDNWSLLVRVDGGDWPTCQDLTEPTFVIEYRRGRPVPEHGQIAAGVLACELAKDACGDRSCRLPRRVSSIDRQGVSVVFDDFNDLDKGGTGIWLIDSWVSSVTQPKRRGRVRSPDLPRMAGRVTTWP